MPTFTWVPDYDATLNTKPRVRVIKFGDGYEQRQGEGINRQPRTYTLTFKRPYAEIDAIAAFLYARGGLESFDYTHPRRQPGVFVCREWVRTSLARGVDSMAATFEEVYE